MGRPREQDIPQNLLIRFDPKLRYLTELAAQVEGITLREYIEKAVWESFAQVSLRKPIEPEPLYGTGPDDAIAAPLQPSDPAVEREHSLARNADSLWHDNPCARLEVLALARPHLLTKEDEQLWNYLHSRSDLKIKGGRGYKLDRTKIAAIWPQLKAAAKDGK
jgi:hypothetical protein